MSVTHACESLTRDACTTMLQLEPIAGQSYWMHWSTARQCVPAAQYVDYHNQPFGMQAHVMQGRNVGDPLPTLANYLFQSRTIKRSLCSNPSFVTQRRFITISPQPNLPRRASDIVSRALIGELAVIATTSQEDSKRCKMWSYTTQLTIALLNTWILPITNQPISQSINSHAGLVVLAHT